jgi:hypothetical protein
MLANPTSLDDFTKISIDQIQQMLPQIDDVHVDERPLSGCEGKHVEYPFAWKKRIKKTCSQS